MATLPTQELDPVASVALAAETARAEGAEAVAKAVADAALPKAGGTMLGKIVLDGDPTSNLHPATKQWVIAQVAALVAGAPGALDTLKEIAVALEADEGTLAALVTTVSGKLSKASNLSDVADATAARNNLSAASAGSVTAEEAARVAADAVVQKAAADALAAHSALTKGVHGIADVAALVTGATLDQKLLEAIASYNEDTTEIHGVPDMGLVAIEVKRAPVTIGSAPSEFKMTVGDVSHAVSIENYEQLQAAYNKAASEYRELQIGYGRFQVAGDTKPKPGCRAIKGVGMGWTTLQSHPEYVSNGPIFGNVLDEKTNLNIPVKNLRFEDLTIDGNYAANAEFTKVATLAEAITGASTKLVFTEDITKIFSPSGRIALTIQIGDNSGTMTYTGMEGLHTLTGAEFVTKSNSEPVNLPAGKKFRQFNESALGLIRFYVYENLEFNRVEIKNAEGYCVGLQGQPEEFATRPDKVYPKINLAVRSSIFSGSYNSDGIDCKEQEICLFENHRGEYNHDKAVNIRGRLQFHYNTLTKGNGTGLGLTSNRLTNPEPFSALVGNLGISDTTITVESTASLPKSGYAHIGCEYIHYNNKTATELLEVTRALEGSKPALHKTHAESSPCYVVGDVAGAEEIDASIVVIGHESKGDVGTGLAIITAGAGTTTRAWVGGCRGFASNRGMLLNASRGQMEATVTGSFFYSNGEGLRAINVDDLELSGVRCKHNSNTATPNGTGHGFAFVNCTNGVVLDHCPSMNNTGYGIEFPANSTTDHMEIIGRRYGGNGLGAFHAMSQEKTFNVGDIFQGKNRPGFSVPYMGGDGLLCAQQNGVLVNKQGRWIRVECPWDQIVSVLPFVLKVSGTNNDKIEGSILDQNYKPLIISPQRSGLLGGGAVLGKKEVELGASVTLYRGGIYYIGFAAEATTTAPQVRMTAADEVGVDIQGGTGSGRAAQISQANAFGGLTVGTALASPQAVSAAPMTFAREK